MFESDAATDGAPAATNVTTTPSGPNITTTPSGPNITTTPSGPNIPQRADRQTELVYKIHDRVTNFVLTKLRRHFRPFSPQCTAVVSSFGPPALSP